MAALERREGEAAVAPIVKFPTFDSVFQFFQAKVLDVFSESFGDATSQDTTSICLDPDGAISWAGLAGVETSFGGLVGTGVLPVLWADVAPDAFWAVWNSWRSWSWLRAVCRPVPHSR